MSEPYILILIALLLSGANYILWWVLYDDEFDDRLRDYQKTHRKKMAEENDEFVSKMQGIIELDPEAMDVIGFEDKWQERIDDVDKLRMESENLKTRVVWVYYISLSAIVLASMGVTFPAGVQVTNSVMIYFTALSWWTVLVGLLVMLGLLTHYQIIEIRTERKSEGTPIGSDTLLERVISGLRNRSGN